MTDRHVLAIDGELNIYRVEELRAALREALAQHACVEVDLAGVTELDGAGVQLLLAARKSAPGLALAHPSPAVREVAELLDLGPHFRNDA